MNPPRKWAPSNERSLLADEPAMAEAERVVALARQYEDEVRLARERLAGAKALLEQSRRMRNPMVPQCDCQHGSAKRKEG
ncbi:hypothetical protein HK414_03665 [Ramlibacter terrae]|uniref:Uncharacterized protein n=1 Tax=Ramlibacter terrae TaxID=2732511 RepID=A0ABX6P1I3_9BURK|nr:hypothetical protein HK414_03665 [Ramlibacter terrae]